MKLFTIACGIAALTSAMLAQAGVEPARFIAGSIPAVPVTMTAGADVIVSAAVSPAGDVASVDVLRTTPPFTGAVVDAVRAWRFSPALDPDRKPISSRVLVQAIARPPSLNAPTVGTPPQDVAAADSRVPFPAQTQPLIYPVNARVEGTVLVEARVDATGHVASATVLRSSPPFDTPALDAARGWTFRPAQGANVARSPYVYLLFVFRQPLVGATSSPGGSTPPPPKTP